MALETSRKQKGTSPSDIVGGCSPANLYLVQLLEVKKSISLEEPSEVRIKMVFQILDRLVPELGVYSELVKLIAEEIYAAVYSPRFTGNSAICSQPSEEVTRIPYFTLLTRIQDERNEAAEKAISELQHARKILSEREDEIRQQKRDTEELQKECQALRSTVAALEENVKEKREELRRLQKDRQTQEKKLVEQISSYKASIQDLQLLLQASQKQIDSLKPYKKVSDDLREAFQTPVEKQNVNNLSPIPVKISAKRRTLIGSKQAQAISFLETTEHLYQQLLQVQNQAMDDFDVYVFSRVKSQLSGDEKLDQHALEKELKEKTAAFHWAMGEICTELSLLQQKKQGLKQQLMAMRARAKKELQPRSHDPMQVSGPGVTSGSSEDADLPPQGGE
ncbi:trichohyalin [Microcaecilia unicolor]|uniref:Trichohyalin-like n=1 Tax=Microcaecilia unicolor TaxID=1415580 RepID=A0A6P7Y5V6_9AMPH|nr:trichohyalin-like [Microcaecilia unicolor]